MDNDDDLLQPVKALLTLEIDTDNFENLRFLSEAIDDFVGIGTHILEWLINDVSAPEYEYTYVVAFFRRALELIDASSILIREGTMGPLKPLLRVLLELSFEIEYFIYMPSTTNIKSYHIAIMELFNILLESERNLLLKGLSNNERIDLQKKVITMQNQIASPIFKFIMPEFENKTIVKNGLNKGKRVPNAPKWYDLSGGGKTFKDLKNTLKHKDMHYHVYQDLSNVVHSSLLIRDSIYSDYNEIWRVVNVRDYKFALENTRVVLRLSIEIYRQVITRCRRNQKEKFIVALDIWRKKYPIFMKI